MSTETTQHTAGFLLWVYTRRFDLDGRRRGIVRIRAGLGGLASILLIDGRAIASDWTPLTGPQSTRNHRLIARLEDGRALSIEVGYVNWRTVGVAVDLDGARIHESHPGKALAYPAKLKAAVEAQTSSGAPTIDYDKLKKNRVPIIVDIATGLLFFAVAKLTDLTTAALVGAGVGVALLLVQRMTRIDLLGGLALFGIVMMLISAGLALAFKNEEFVKQRSTIVGLIGAALFLVDGVFGGRYLGERMSRYLAYTDVIPRRLSIGLGVSAIAMAGLNWFVAKSFSTDIWLFYTTFGDFFVAMIVFFFMLGWARGGKNPFGV